LRLPIEVMDNQGPSALYQLITKRLMYGSRALVIVANGEKMKFDEQLYFAVKASTESVKYLNSMSLKHWNSSLTVMVNPKRIFDGEAEVDGRELQFELEQMEMPAPEDVARYPKRSGFAEEGGVEELSGWITQSLKDGRLPWIAIEANYKENLFELVDAMLLAEGIMRDDPMFEGGVRLALMADTATPLEQEGPRLYEPPVQKPRVFGDMIKNQKFKLTDNVKNKHLLKAAAQLAATKLIKAPPASNEAYADDEVVTTITKVNMRFHHHPMSWSIGTIPAGTQLTVVGRGNRTEHPTQERRLLVRRQDTGEEGWISCVGGSGNILVTSEAPKAAIMAPSRFKVQAEYKMNKLDDYARKPGNDPNSMLYFYVFPKFEMIRMDYYGMDQKEWEVQGEEADQYQQEEEFVEG